jgi:hypothetical protein
MVSSTACEPLRHFSWREGLDRPHRRARLALLPVAAILILASAATWSDARLGGQLSDGGGPAELIYLPPTPVLRAMSLGYEHALADVLWFRTMNYFGKHYRSDRAYPWLAYMCDVVTDLDPQAEHVYRFGGVLLPWEADRIDDGIALLEKGTRNVPDSWRLHYMLGFSYYFFTGDLAAASRTLRTATLLPGAPDFVAHLAAIVQASDQGPDSAIAFLSELERTADEGVRAAIQDRIGQLSLARDIDALEAAVRTFRSRFNRQPGTLAELVAAGIVPAIPPEPFGGVYVLDRTTGHVRSSVGHTAWRLGSSAMREAFLKKRGKD